MNICLDIFEIYAIITTMLHIKCIKCEQFLMRPGGLLFSPQNCHGMSYKYNICTKCYDELIRFLKYKYKQSLKLKHEKAQQQRKSWEDSVNE